MRRVLGPDEFVRWLETFLPPPQSARFRPLSIPIEVRDPKDPRIGHLIGLAWERAACFLESPGRFRQNIPGGSFL